MSERTEQREQDNPYQAGPVWSPEPPRLDYGSLKVVRVLKIEKSGQTNQNRVSLVEIREGERAVLKEYAGKLADLREYTELRTLREIDGAEGVPSVYFHYPQERALVMEYLEGESAFRALRERGALEEGRAMYVGLMVARALRAVHSVGRKHGDVKPGNILLASSGEVTLLDYELARKHREQLPSVWGTVPYMAPEAFENRAGAAADIWSLGATIIHIKENRVPFGNGGSEEEVVRQMLQRDPPLELQGGNGRLNALILSMLEGAEENRPTIDEVIQELERIL